MEVGCLALRDLGEVGGGKHDQKENICASERRRTTPHKVEPTAATSLYGRLPPAAPELVNITPIKHPDLAHLHPDPWTPTANLKMLISAASPDIRDREMRKVLFRPIENEEEKTTTTAEEAEDVDVDDHCQFDAVEDGGEEDSERKPSRKQKSLGLLCHKFLALYPDYPASPEPINISLDEVASGLGVERRRIYDIVNVLESLKIVGRVAKNQYVWNGRQRLEETLAGLQGLGRRQRYHLYMEPAREAREQAREQAMETRAVATQTNEDGDPSYAAANKRKDKSLLVMSQKFVMLFLVSETQTITLDIAAKVLIEENQDAASQSKYKTKVRRLYDIANVLTSLGLIQKVYVREEGRKKPAFKWIGPADFLSSNEDSEAVLAILPEAPVAPPPAAALGSGKQKLSRHASFSVVPTSAASQRRVNSAASSPRREMTSLLPEDFPEDFLSSNEDSEAVLAILPEAPVAPPPAAALGSAKQKLSRHASFSVVPTSAASQRRVNSAAADFLSSNEDSEAVLAIVLPEAPVAPPPAAALGSAKQKLSRHASFSVVPTSAASQRRVNSAASSPRREMTSLLPQPVDYSWKCASNSAVCRPQFGNTTDAQPSTGLRTPPTRSPPLLHWKWTPPLDVPIRPYGPPPPPSFSPHPHPHHQLVFTYGGPTAPDRTAAEGQRSPGEVFPGKRKREEDEGEKASRRDQQESWETKDSGKRGSDGRREAGNSSRTTSPRTSPGRLGTLPREEPPSRAVRDWEVGRHGPQDLAQPSHYLYVPNSAGLNSLNFLPGGLTLPPGSVPTLAMPYVLVPSSALSPYPLLTNGGTHGNLNFSLPSIMSPAHFVVSSGHFAVAGETEFSGSVVLSSPEQAGLSGSGAALPPPPHSPSAPRQSVAPLPLKEPQTPPTPKEAVVSGGSKAFFQTPGALGFAPRQRGSAQRRLDIGHPPTN